MGPRVCRRGWVQSPAPRQSGREVRGRRRRPGREGPGRDDTCLGEGQADVPMQGQVTLQVMRLLPEVVQVKALLL